MRLHINCIEFGWPWASLAFMLNISRKYEMEITFSILVFSPPLQVSGPQRFAPEVDLEDLGLPQRELGVEGAQLPGPQEFRQNQVCRGASGQGSSI